MQIKMETYKLRENIRICSVWCLCIFTHIYVSICIYTYIHIQKMECPATTKKDEFIFANYKNMVEHRGSICKIIHMKTERKLIILKKIFVPIPFVLGNIHLLKICCSES